MSQHTTFELPARAATPSPERPGRRRHAPVFVLEALEPRRMLAAVDVTINPASLNQTWQGFGASMISWANLENYNQATFFNEVVGDAGLNGLRVPVWPAFEPSNDNSDPNVIDWSKFNVNSLNPTLKLAQQMAARGADLFLASVWTPPWWMKATSAHSYGGPLRPDMREEFAEYLAAYVISAQRDFGITFDAISIQNEPQFIEPYESTLYTPQQMISTIKAVQQRFAAEGITTKVMTPEELTLFDRWDWWDAGFRADPQVWNSDLIWGTHFAAASHFDELKRTVTDSGQPLWLTEAAGKGDASWNGGLRLSEDIAGMMNEAETSAFFEWQLDDPNDGTSSLYKGPGVKTTRYQVVKHYAHWIRPGARRHGIALSDNDIDNNGQRDLFVTSWHHAGNDAQTIVLTNNFTEPVTYRVQIQGTRPGHTWRAWRSVNNSYHQQITGFLGGPSPTHTSFEITLPARSMVTMYDGTGDPRPPLSNTTARGPQSITSPVDIQFNHAVRRIALQGNPTLLQQYANQQNIHEEFVNGRDAIFAAAASPRPDVIAVMDVLIGLGADLNKRDVEGITPLMVVASTPMTWFTTQSADPTLPSRKITRLLDAGAQLHAKDDRGRTALHWAGQMPRWLYSAGFPHDPQVVQTLLQRGADKNKVDRFGRTPLMWAQQEGHYANASTLQAWSQDSAAPEVMDKAFLFQTRQAAQVDFDEAMAAFSATQLGVFKLDGSGNPSSAVNVAVNRITLAGGNTRAELVPSLRLPNGRYRVAVKSGQSVRDAAGNGLASSAGANLGEFWFLNADANRDQIVDSRDYLTLRQNFGRAGVGFSGGDFDYDGLVTLKDFRILRDNFGLTPDAGAPAPDGDPPLPGADPPQPGGLPPGGGDGGGDGDGGGGGGGARLTGGTGDSGEDAGGQDGSRGRGFPGGRFGGFARAMGRLGFAGGSRAFPAGTFRDGGAIALIAPDDDADAAATLDGTR